MLPQVLISSIKKIPGSCSRREVDDESLLPKLPQRWHVKIVANADDGSLQDLWFGAFFLFTLRYVLVHDEFQKDFNSSLKELCTLRELFSKHI